MTRNIMTLGMLAMVFLSGVRGSAWAQPCGKLPDLLIVQDRSGSMGITNWNAAKNAINNLVATYGSQMNFGLSLFPTSGSCTAGPPSVPVSPNTQAAIMNILNGTSASGSATPIAGALTSAHAALTAINPGTPKYALLVTDGSETCGGDPVQAAGMLMGAGIKTFVVGFGSGVNVNQLNNIAINGGTAKAGATKYYQAANQVDLNAALQAIAGAVSCCGNGNLDPGETCDTSIPAGAPGACPLTCNDGKACTVDGTDGKACKTTCLFTPITSPKNGDGCCPPGANSVTDSDCPAKCGNGVFEAGESCDPAIASGPGKCPTPASCNDKNVCTTDTVAGTGCQLKCAHVAKKASAAAKDGCCPVGASSLTDKDCSPSCGNGLLESSETCDPKISSGKGKCPTLSSCDDKNVCTKDSLIGGGCSLKCGHASVKASLTTKDGCCPKGASATTDRDCKAACGNGVLESGELCDPKITSGPGKCTTIAACNDGDKCTKDMVQGSACQRKCVNKDFPATLAKDGCCPAGHSSVTDADCLPPCGPDRIKNCVNLCKDKTCKTGYCKQGKCVPWPNSSDGSTWGGDGGGPPGQGNGFVGQEGCACNTAGSGGGASALLFLGLGIVLLAWRRRRQTGRRY